MKRIKYLLDELRQETQVEFEGTNDDKEFFSLLVGLDTAEDASEALLNYETQGLGASLGERYLRLYGLLQAVVLQQDAIRRIGDSLMPGVKASPGAAWKELRDLRNMTAGHPVAYGRDRSNLKQIFISRMTISEAGFQYEVWDKTKPEPTFRDADLTKLYGDYKREAQMMLENILASIKGQH